MGASCYQYTLGNTRLLIDCGVQPGLLGAESLPKLARLKDYPLEQRTGYVLPCRSRQAVYGRLEAACKQARVKFKGVHALRHASGTRLRDETGDLVLVADHLRHSSLDTARGYAKANNVQLKKALGEW